MELNGYLMSGDLVIAEIHGGRITRFARQDLAPLYLAAGGKLDEWLAQRAIDRHRPNSRILKKILRLSDTSDLSAVLRAHGATITDNYWVRTDSEPSLTYSQIRFTEDIFSELALTGSYPSYSKRYTEEQLASNTPELTNIGSYEKCWRIENGQWWLYKNGTPLERFSELFISALGKAMGLPMAEYLPSDRFVKTRDFTEGRMNFEPASAFVGDEEDYVFNYDRLMELSPALGRQYLDILYMDALCFNMDRHTQNYGVLRDQTTGAILSMAPNFDNNIALISRGYDGDPLRSHPLLIQLFEELLRKRDISYTPPALDIRDIQAIAERTLPEEEIDRTYVTDLVWDRAQRLEQILAPMQGMEQPSNSLSMDQQMM